MDLSKNSGWEWGYFIVRMRVMEYRQSEVICGNIYTDGHCTNIGISFFVQNCHFKYIFAFVMVQNL